MEETLDRPAAAPVRPPAAPAAGFRAICRDAWRLAAPYWKSPEKKTALLLKHDFLFLDEATSALDEASEAYFYRILRETLPNAAIVSVGHRHTLKEWHDRVLDLKPEAA